MHSFSSASLDKNGSIVLQLKNISKHFESVSTIQNINFSVKQGEFVTLLGPSGCGKTTILNLISGLEEPDSGEILINNTLATALPPQERHVNTVFQSYALFPHLTVFENVAFGLRCKRFKEDEIKRRVIDALSMVKLEKLVYRYPNQLSGGQQQRIAIARAVVNRPRVLLLDEPLSSLDYRLRKTMQIELKQLQIQLKIAFILVTHDQEEALSISDRVIVMNEGRIMQIGTPREVYEEPCNLQVAKFIGETNIFETVVKESTALSFTATVEDILFTFKNHHHFQREQSIAVLIRPEDLKIYTKTEKPENQETLLKGKVTQVIYKGSTVDLIIRLSSERLLAATQFFNEDDSALDFEIGELVWVSWIPGWEVILSNEI